MAVTIQSFGSVVPLCHTLAKSFVPSEWKRSVCSTPAAVRTGVCASDEIVPWTHFKMTNSVPSIYALYQFIESVQRSTIPKFTLFPNWLTLPLTVTSTLSVGWPITASRCSLSPSNLPYQILNRERLLGIRVHFPLMPIARSSP